MPRSFVASGALNIVTGHRERLEALQLRAALVARAQGAALANPIWEYDQDAGLAVLKGSLDDPEFVEAVVVDDTGAVFATVRQPKAAENKDDLVVARRGIEILSPNGDMRSLGSVELRFWGELVHRKLLAALVVALVEFVALVLVVSLGLILALRHFTKPIEEMTQVIRKRARGDLSLDVDPAYLRRTDEIGAIAQSLELDQQQRRDEAKLLEITSDVSSEAHVGTFLGRLATAAHDLVEADRCTVYVHDARRRPALVGRRRGPRVA